MKSEIHEVQIAGKVLADPTRYAILEFLINTPGGCVGDIADHVGISHSAASHQLSKLEARGIVTHTREGKTMCYELQKTPFTHKLQKVMRLFEKA